MTRHLESKPAKAEGDIVGRILSSHPGMALDSMAGAIDAEPGTAA